MTGENTNQYTADATTNHIFTMTKTGGNYDPITINVSLNKAEFTNTNDNSKVGWGTGNAIPGDWDFEITSVNINPSTPEFNPVKVLFIFPPRMKLV